MPLRPDTAHRTPTPRSLYNQEHSFDNEAREIQTDVRGTRMIMKKHSLAGTCGIPTDAQRIYIPVDANGADDPDHGPSDPVTIHWPDGRSWKVESIYARQEFAAPSSVTSVCVTTSASRGSAKRSGGSTATGSSSAVAAWR